MTNFSWSEVFMSLEGEGPYVGIPTVYVRFTGCNFTCKRFNNPDNLDTTSIEVLGFDPKDYKSIYDIPLITKGCDSIYSWDPKFKHMWQTGDENALAELIVNTLPHKSWVHPVSGTLDNILSITGGEPMLYAKQLPALLDHPLLQDVTTLLIETNGSVPIHKSFLDYLSNWIEGPNRKLVWSNSPKLSVSGEVRSKAIRPEVLLQQRSIASLNSNRVEQYVKFVCGSIADFDEVEEVLKIYEEHNIFRHQLPVYIMPMACQPEQQTEITQLIANECINRGYRYSHRVHLEIWGNTVGT